MNDGIADGLTLQDVVTTSPSREGSSQVVVSSKSCSVKPAHNRFEISETICTLLEDKMVEIYIILYK